MSLNTLLAVKSKLRDGEWEESFFATLGAGNIRVLSENPQEGPEGFPYLLTTSYGQDYDEPFTKVAHWCADTGVGIVLNPTEDGEDYLFTFGMLWNYKYRGEFYSQWTHEETEASAPQMVIRKITDVFWPEKPRKIFKEFLIHQSILRPRVCLFSKSASSDPELGISLECLGNPPQRERAQLLEAFSWFFPRHYALVLVSEADIGTQHFIDV
ncbi:MAG: hypothetical protein IT287_04655 [Bdellovibrionaceae bacterium]|nr:hypothetical protein [Pseudobdellovibrionaceae bacterium]